MTSAAKARWADGDVPVAEFQSGVDEGPGPRCSRRNPSVSVRSLRASVSPVRRAAAVAGQVATDFDVFTLHMVFTEELR